MLTYRRLSGVGWPESGSKLRALHVLREFKSWASELAPNFQIIHSPGWPCLRQLDWPGASPNTCERE
jgi:hypothetical protein